MRPLIVGLVCLLVGLGAGFAAGRGTSSRERALSSSLSSATAPSSISSAPGSTVASSSPSMQRSSMDARSSAIDPSATRDERLRALEQEIARLRGVVDAVNIQRREIEGTPIAFPPGHAADVDERAFHDSLKKVLAARGIDGEVQALDCTEFPCIAHGLIRKDIDDLTMRGIADDAKKSLGWGVPYLSLSRFLDDKNPANSKSAFSVAIYPDDLPPDEQANMNKRLRDRKNAYTDTN